MRKELAPNPVSGNEQRGNPKEMNERERRSRQLPNQSTGKTTGNRRATGEEQKSTAELSRGGEVHPTEPPLLAPTCPHWTMRIPYLLLINHYGHFLAEMRFSHSLDIIRLQIIFTWVQSYLQDEPIHRIAH